MANPKLGECVTATSAAGDRHVCLKVEYTQTGWVAQVVETDGNTEVAHEIADNLKEGKQRAEQIAKSYLANKDLKLPAIRWKKNRKACLARQSHRKKSTSPK